MRNVTGDLRGAEADARAALDCGGLGARPSSCSGHRSVESLAEQGKAAQAEAVLRDHGLIGELPPAPPYTALLVPRARMHAMAGHLEAAQSDLDEARRRLDQARGGGAVSGLEARLRGRWSRTRSGT